MSPPSIPPVSFPGPPPPLILNLIPTPKKTHSPDPVPPPPLIPHVYYYLQNQMVEVFKEPFLRAQVVEDYTQVNMKVLHY